jgi:LysR family transcriptional regulator for bpeEF and oprC
LPLSQPLESRDRAHHFFFPLIDRFQGMEVFTRVVELGSFSRAGLALRMPKARVSVVVQALEAHLGVRLLHRTTRRLSLTDEGALVHQRALALLGQMRELEDALHDPAGAPCGRLRVDVPAAFGRQVVAPALPDFFRRYPEVVVELGSSDRPVDLLAEGYDFVVRGGEVHDERLVVRPLGRLPVITCAAPAYLDAHGTPHGLDDLAQHRFVNFYSPRDGHLFPFDFHRGGEHQQLHGTHRVACNDADTYIAAGVAGLGLVQLPCTRAVIDHLAHGRLVPVLADWSAGGLPLTLLQARRPHPMAKLRAFSDWLVALFQREFDGLPSQLDSGSASPWLAIFERPPLR